MCSSLSNELSLDYVLYVNCMRLLLLVLSFLLIVIYSGESTFHRVIVYAYLLFISEWRAISPESDYYNS